MNEHAPAAAGDAGRRFHVEQYGFEVVPEADRYMTLRDLGYFWTATNLYLFNFAVGAIAFSFGLPLWTVVLCVVAGNAAYGLVALGSIPGAKTGVPTLTITRAAFGHEANRANCFLAWVLGVSFEVVNVVFGVFAVVAFLQVAGWDNPGTAGKLVGLVVVYLTSIGVALLGHATLIFFQRIFAVALGVVMLLVAAYALPDVNLSAGGAAGHSASETAGLMLLTAGVIAGAGLAYMQIPSDYTRYISARAPSRSIFWTVLISAGGTALALSLLGALVASRADLSDPVAGVEPLIPSWLYWIFLLAVVGGSVSNNIITLYSSAFAVQTIGVRVSRIQATMLDGVVATLLIVYVLFLNDNFLSALNDMIALVVVWIGPFGAIWVVDALMRRHRYAAAELHAGRGGRYYGTRGVNVSGAVAWVAGALAAALTMNAPVFQGPLSKALLADGDLSWLIGPVVGGLVYFALAHARVGAAEPAPDIRVGAEDDAVPEAVAMQG
ncbi:MAG: nucleobase:cation symporter, family [Solirubrobacteraceae bacterium]|nr:nucleobase:cation symporter, family [Solirubrobacteraceae bacterium]